MSEDFLWLSSVFGRLIQRPSRAIRPRSLPNGSQCYCLARLHCGPFSYLLARARLYALPNLISILSLGLRGCENAIILILQPVKTARSCMSLRAVWAILAHRRTVTNAWWVVR